MHAQYPVIDNSCSRKLVECETELLPNLDIVSTFNFIVETVHSVDLLTFVIASEHKEIFWEFDFIAHHETNCFDTLLSSVDVITNKQEFLFGTWPSSNFK